VLGRYPAGEQMRRLASISAIALVTNLVGRAVAGVWSWTMGRLGVMRDEANIRRLARHEHCSIEDARRLYELARVEGYGAAHRAVFGSRDSESSPKRPAA